MEDITHKHVGVGGLNLHVAEIGSGLDVLLLHGFPEIWYSWRYQMIAFANAGFHAIAPDYRGYGLSDQPSELEKATYVDLAKDMVGLLDAFSIKKVFIVGKDFGGFVAYLLGLLYPDRVTGIVTLGAPYRRPVPETFQPDLFPEGFYMRRWMWEQLSYVIDFGIQAPCLLIVGSEDYLLKFPGMELYITSEILKTDVPNLEIKFISGGCHFVQEQFPEKPAS